MKKLFALLLAAVMLLGMIGMAGAAEFTDAAEISQMNTEAVAVLSGMGIIGGMGDGTFQPDGTLTRAQAAKILAYMLLGKDKAEALPAATAAFTDVPTSHWSCKYVNYCAEQGVVSGVGGGKFNPNGQLTGFQFGKMVLVAIGFSAEQEGLTGSDWDKNVNKLVKSECLNLGVSVDGKEISRQDACHLALNALFHGEEDDTYNTLAYKTFTVTRSKGSLDKDDFRRPLMLYTSDEEDICWEGTELTVKASPTLVYRDTVTCGKVSEELGGKSFDAEHTDGTRNGPRYNPNTFADSNSYIMPDSTVKFMCSGPGVITEFYYCGSEQTIHFVQIGLRAFKIVEVEEAVVSSDGTVLQPGTVTVTALGNPISVESDEFTEADIGTFVLCKVYGKSSWKEAVELKEVIRPTIVTGKLQSEDKTVKVDGKTYTTLYSTMATAQDVTPYPADYIAAGGSVGDTINLVLDDAGVCYAIYQ
ncbi:MAG: S-layer homology domain-containing protein [Oscillospiraceae bacterium]|nr:S-layer homology domain-containing protein [Oscillospiraceae bacterium]